MKEEALPMLRENARLAQRVEHDLRASVRGTEPMCWMEGVCQQCGLTAY